MEFLNTISTTHPKLFVSHSSHIISLFLFLNLNLAYDDSLSVQINLIELSLFV